MSSLFSILTNPLSLSTEPIYEWIILGIIGIISFKIAYSIVGDTEFRGALGSLLHWIIRFAVFVFLWAITEGTIRIVKFAIEYKTIIATIVIVIITVFVIVALIKKINGDKHERNEK